LSDCDGGCIAGRINLPRACYNRRFAPLDAVNIGGVPGGPRGALFGQDQEHRAARYLSNPILLIPLVFIMFSPAGDLCSRVKELICFIAAFSRSIIYRDKTALDPLDVFGDNAQVGSKCTFDRIHDGLALNARLSNKMGSVPGLEN
jgi:hypothetical protein